MSKTTKGEDLVENVKRIAGALEELKNRGLPRSILLLWVKKKTRLPQRDIQAVFDALAEIKKEFDLPA